jgi:hypothetical protein
MIPSEAPVNIDVFKFILTFNIAIIILFALRKQIVASNKVQYFLINLENLSDFLIFSAKVAIRHFL